MYSPVHRVKENVMQEKQTIAMAVSFFAVAAALLAAGRIVESCDEGDGSRPVPSYELIADQTARQRFVLMQVAKRDMPSTWDDWVTVKAKSQKGTEVEFQVSPHPLRIGTDKEWTEVSLDGPHATAAAELVGCTLPTAWMVEQIHLQAKKEGGAVHFFTATEIASTLGWKWNPNQPDGNRMLTPEFFRKRNELLHGWLNDKSVKGTQLISGYYKDVVYPASLREGLEIYGGYDDQGNLIQPLTRGVHSQGYLDPFIGVRFARPEIKVNGESMTFGQFFGSAEYALEFRFEKTAVAKRAYNYSPRLVKLVGENTTL